MKQYEIDIARRLTFGGDKGRRSPAVKVAEVSVALSIAVMIIAIGIVYGFKQEITRKVIGLNPQITIYPMTEEGVDRPYISLDEDLTAFLDSLPYIKKWEPMVNTLALLKSKDNFQGLYLNGLSGTYDTSFLSENLTEGSLPDFKNSKGDSNKILISAHMANDMKLAAGDSINVYSFGNGIGLKRMKVEGVYDTHLDMFDKVLAYTPLSTASQLGEYGQWEVSAINISVGDIERVPEATSRLINDFTAYNQNLSNLSPQSVTITNILEQCRGIFGWLGMLDTNVWVIITLLTLVSAFTLISGMLIIILEKVRFIGVMKAMGASSASIRHIFVWLAMRIGSRGILYGTIAGLGLLALQHFFKLLRLNPEAYYMNYAPVAFPWLAFAGVIIGFSLIIYLILVLPSRMVSRISPSESMRFE